jgi:hypothetical protein
MSANIISYKSLVIIVAISLTMLSITVTSTWHIPQQAKAQAESTAAAPSSSSTGALPTTNFLTYQNSTLGISIGYPSDWRLVPHSGLLSCCYYYLTGQPFIGYANNYCCVI